MGCANQHAVSVPLGVRVPHKLTYSKPPAESRMHAVTNPLQNPAGSHSQNWPTSRIGPMTSPWWILRILPPEGGGAVYAQQHDLSLPL